MTTEDLITILGSDVKAVSRHAVGRRLLLSFCAGGAATLVLVGFVLGFRPDLVTAMHGFAFWMKWIYTISLGIGASVMVARLARPETVRLRRFWPVAIPFVLLAIVGGVEMAHVPVANWLPMWLGKSWRTCPWAILALSAPIFVGLLWAFRRLAPTRLRAAGAAVGLAAGAWAASLYCLFCPEVSAIFVLTWYTLGISLAALVGALLGPKLLRW